MSQLWRQLRKTIPNLLFIIEKSANKNIVVYEGHMRPTGFHGDIDSYWLDLDPEYQKQAREKGIMSDKVELSTLEKYYAYGFSLTSSKTHPLIMVMDSFSELSIYLGTTVHHHPVAYTYINGKKCRLESIFVHMYGSLIKPNITSINIIGTNLETGKEEMQSIQRK